MDNKSDWFKNVIAQLESPEGKEATRLYFEELAEKERLSKIHINKVHEELSQLTDEQFEIILLAEFDLNGDAWRGRCYSEENCEPYPQEKLNDIINVMFEYGKNLEESVDGEDMFFTGGAEYKGYVIHVYHGQGSFYRFFKDGIDVFTI